LLLLVGCSAPQHSHPVRDNSWISDRASLLTDSGRGRIRSILRRIHKSTDAQFVVATIDKAGDTPRAKAMELFNTWKLGTAQANNGILLMISREDRAVEIVTGKGLDAVLSNAGLQVLLRQTVIPEIRAGRTEDAIAKAATHIGATLKGFKTHDPPQSALLLLSLFGAAVGFAGAAQLHRLWRSPLLLPPTGRRDHNVDFKDLRSIPFFRAEAEALDPRYDRKFSPNAILLTWLGLTLCGAALAGYLASLSPGFSSLEPWFSALWAIAFLSAALTTFAMQPPADDDFEKLGVSAVVLAFLATLPAGYITSNFVSPFVAATIVLPLFALAVNALSGWYWFSELKGASASIPRAACNKCRCTLATAMPDTFLNDWERRALQDGRVGFRAWHCPKCFPSPQLSEQIYLSCSIPWKSVVCANCKQFAVGTVREKKNKQSLLCKACGHKRPDPDYSPSKQSSGGSGYAPSSSDSSDSSSSSSSDHNNAWENNSSYDPPESGGLTSGGGTSDNW